jgi:hypothetical protein
VDDDDDSEKHDHQDESYDHEVCQYAHTLVVAPSRYKQSRLSLSVFEALSHLATIREERFLWLATSHMRDAAVHTMTLSMTLIGVLV